MYIYRERREERGVDGRERSIEGTNEERRQGEPKSQKLDESRRGERVGDVFLVAFKVE